MLKGLTRMLNTAKREIERKLFFLAWLNSQLKKEGSTIFPVIIGGTAVEIHTDGCCYSFDSDIDLVYDADEKFDAILKCVGFAKYGCYWKNEELDLVVECSGSTKECPERITTLNINGESIYVISIEDLVIDRLNGFVFWDSCNDNSGYLHQLKQLFAHRKIDYEYLLRRAREEGTYEALEKVYSRP